MTMGKETGQNTEIYPVVESRRELALGAALTLNEDRTDSVNLTLERVILDSYKDWFKDDEMSKKDKKNAYRRASNGYNGIITGILKAQETTKPVSKSTKKIIEETDAAIRSTEGLPDLTPEERTLILRRINNYTFSTLLEDRRLKEKGETLVYKPTARLPKLQAFVYLLLFFLFRAFFL